MLRFKSAYRLRGLTVDGSTGPNLIVLSHHACATVRLPTENFQRRTSEHESRLTHPCTDHLSNRSRWSSTSAMGLRTFSSSLEKDLSRKPDIDDPIRRPRQPTIDVPQ